MSESRGIWRAEACNLGGYRAVHRTSYPLAAIAIMMQRRFQPLGHHVLSLQAPTLYQFIELRSRFTSPRVVARLSA